MFGHFTKVAPGICLVFATLARAGDAGDCGVLPPPPWQMTQLLPVVARCNRDVVAAQGMLMAADAEVRVSSQRPNPTLTLGVSNINPQAGIGPGNLFDKTVDTAVRLDQPIERGGKAALRQATATASRQASRSDLEMVVRQQQAEFIKDWHTAVAAGERRDLLAEMLALSRQSEALASKRVQAGDLPANDLTRISLETLRAETDLHQAEAEVRESGLAVLRLLGVNTASDSLTLSPAWPETVAPVTPAEPVAIENRPDVAALRARLESARSARDLARALTREDISVGLQVDHWPTSAANQQGTGNSLSLSVSLPLAIRHQHQGEIQRSEADYRLAQDALDSARQTALNDLAARQAAVEAARRRLDILQSRIIPASRQIADRAETAYAKGAGSVLDLLDSRRQLRQVSLEGVAARLDYARALVDWRLAAGTTPDASEVPSSLPVPASVTESRQ